VRGLDVHEIGAGVAVPGLACACSQAACVIVSDHDPCACVVTQRACDHNANVLGEERLRRVQALTLDWFAALEEGFQPPAMSDVVLAIDVNYYSSANPALLAIIRACLRLGGHLALASRLGRAGLPAFLDMLAAADSGFSLVAEEVFASDVPDAQDKMFIYQRLGQGKGACETAQSA
jgi:predicted nicotinamide N-methyase